MYALRTLVSPLYNTITDVDIPSLSTLTGVYAEVDAHFHAMAEHLNATLHDTYGLNMSAPYLLRAQSATFVTSLENLSAALQAWAAHQARRSNLFFS